MENTSLYQTETSKPIDQFVKDLAEEGKERGFVIHNEDKMEMAHTFGREGMEVAEGFDLHMIQVCKPEKAFKSLSTNPERAAFMPKFIMTFSGNGKTQIRMLVLGTSLIDEHLPDKAFQDSISASYESIIDMIEAAK